MYMVKPYSGSTIFFILLVDENIDFGKKNDCPYPVLIVNVAEGETKFSEK